ncbi:Glycerol kinase 2 [Cavenderia fasciculata]|uniref:Probable glycerol kinase n=1 Tax=Cavenderia fasciculata TaxID=261658 RepID=F4PW24_CACFS|nr:Glycerol kinase 2 [Cavenderia fasciculata]EGG20188.1 Glycerol kinase 2 [Cavenderia fasciculata]|eukprot:XP_004367171.1 Glycerol kinase 2 [Cavenderia fasciculata]
MLVNNTLRQHTTTTTTRYLLKSLLLHQSTAVVYYYSSSSFIFEKNNQSTTSTTTSIIDKKNESSTIRLNQPQQQQYRYFSSSSLLGTKNKKNQSKEKMVFVKPYVGAIDQGTSSTRFMLFDSNGQTVLSHQILLPQHHPNPGWVEHDGKEIIKFTNECIENVMQEYYRLGLGEKSDIKAIGITNQRETTIAWNKNNGQPYHHAVVWCDTRTSSLVSRFTEKAAKLAKYKDLSDEERDNQSKNHLRQLCGLPINNYFSALKMRWLIENVKELNHLSQPKDQKEEEDVIMGTIDSWLVWNLTGGGVHITDVTNASRTMLMNLKTLQWDKDICEFLEVPMNILPKIKSSSEIYGYIKEGPLEGIPIGSVLGDQQSAMVGQMCFKKGQAKNTYGTGCFLLYNTGNEIVQSTHGLLTTVCYQLGKDAEPCYALEGSVAVAGAGVKWLVDNLGIASSADEVEELAGKVENNAGVYIVPAFSGLFAPYWRDDARGVIVGMTHQTNRCHIARAMLESTCFQTHEVLSSMEKDANTKLTELRVDGGMTKNELLMQMQSNILGLPVVKPYNSETTCFGAAFAAGLTVGVWKQSMEFKVSQTFTPFTTPESNAIRIKEWHKAVSKSINWVEKSY